MGWFKEGDDRFSIFSSRMVLFWLMNIFFLLVVSVLCLSMLKVFWLYVFGVIIMGLDFLA